MINQCHIGDCRDTMRDLIAQGVRVQCCVTSPPYYGLRDYGHPGQIGLEKTPAEYVAALVEVFEGVRELLADDGVLWLNLGSSYAGGIPGSGGKTSKQVTNAGSFFSGGTRPSQSLQPLRAPACDSNGTALPDSTGADSACSGLCDGCLADFLIHRERIAGTGQQSEQCAPLPSPTGRDIELLDCAPAIPDASLLDAQESTTLESWRQRRGVCSRCDARASSLSMLPPSLLGARESVRSSWVNYTTRFKPKDMIPIPWMVAMALQADGWYLRSDIIWEKPNPMPESVTDRPTKAHEYLFLLAKSARYYYDAEAVKEAYSEKTWFYEKTMPTKAAKDGKSRNNNGTGKSTLGTPEYLSATGRNRRSVWTIATAPYAGAHFATFPPALVEPCILAGSRPGDVVLDPFFGSGTVGQVCERLGRQWIGCELNEEYGKLAARRTSQMGMTL